MIFVRVLFIVGSRLIRSCSWMDGSAVERHDLCVPVRRDSDVEHGLVDFRGVPDPDPDELDDGDVAVKMVKEKKYDLILMDVRMKRMGGYEATQEIRLWEDENNKPKTPIIALTAHALQADIEEAKAKGCDGHITKPIIKSDLIKKIYAIVHDGCEK